jgi:chromate transporter
MSQPVPAVSGAPPAVASVRALQPCTLREFLLYFLRLGTFGFGGPIALTGYMQRDLVERRRWISEQDYKEGLALAQLAPGPLAAQLAIYLGWIRARILGATLVAVAFIAPSFLMVLAISWLYVRFGGLPWMQGLFYGIGAAVIALIARSATKLLKMTLGRDRLLWLLFAISALVTAWTESEIFSVFVASGLVAMAVRAWPWRAIGGQLAVLIPPIVSSSLWLGSTTGNSAAPGLLWTIFWFFAQAGSVVFGGGLAIVPFLHGGVVQHYGWLTEQQFLDAVAVAMITPGPVVITVAFIGYLIAGVTGATIASLGVFLPVYLFVVIPAPYFRRFAANRQVHAFVEGVTAAATGAIAGATFVLGRRALFDVTTVAICLLTLVLILKVKKIPEPAVILAAGLVGLVLRGLVP